MKRRACFVLSSKETTWNIVACCVLRSVSVVIIIQVTLAQSRAPDLPAAHCKGTTTRFSGGLNEMADHS